jgi:hypothetical protein
MRKARSLQTARPATNRRQACDYERGTGGKKGTETSGMVVAPKRPSARSVISTSSHVSCASTARSHWDNVHQNNINDNGTYPKLCAGITYPSGGRAKASGTMIEVVTGSLGEAAVKVASSL